MTSSDTSAAAVHEHRTRTNRVPRSRGAVSGLLLMLLGLWGALVPFIGPYFDYSYGSNQKWHWTAGRGWLEVLPGAVCLVGGFLLLTSKSRIRGSLGGWLAALAGAWFVIGKTVASWWHTGGVGEPLSRHVSGRAVADLGYFYGLGAVILFLAAFALGRLAVVGVRDIAAAERDEERAAEQARRDAEITRQREAQRAEAQRLQARDDEERRLAEERAARPADDRAGYREAGADARADARGDAGGYAGPRPGATRSDTAGTDTSPGYDGRSDYNPNRPGETTGGRYDDPNGTPRA